nr:MAG TPA: hypothetical protein [Caudoviricetes sp.]
MKSPSEFMQNNCPLSLIANSFRPPFLVTISRALSNYSLLKLATFS